MPAPHLEISCEREAYQSLYQDPEDTFRKSTESPSGQKPLCWTWSPVERNAYLPADLNGPPWDSQVFPTRWKYSSQNLGDGKSANPKMQGTPRWCLFTPHSCGGGSPPVCPLLTAQVPWTRASVGRGQFYIRNTSKC